MYQKWIHKKKIYPVGAGGKTLLCRSCGSYRHLLNDCPGSWESFEKKKASVDKQMREIVQSNKEKVRCSEEPEGVTEPEIEGACRGFMISLMAEMAEMKSLHKEIMVDMKEVLIERKTEEVGQTQCKKSKP